MKTWERISGEEKGILFLRVCVELESGNSVTQKGYPVKKSAAGRLRIVYSFAEWEKLL